jgi:two-component system response regulator YesN
MTSYVLLVDDEKLIRDLCGTIFKIAGIKYKEASDGDTALKLALDLEPEFVITDYNLPGLNGMELIERLQKNYPLLKCLLMSGSIDLIEFSKQRSIDIHKVDFLAKPFSPDTLLNYLNVPKK